MESVNLDGLSFEAFVAVRDRLRGIGGLVDMSETNLYASLPMSFPGSFEPLAESLDPKAPYRCHLTELFLERWGFSPSMKARCSATRGVRASLSGVFAEVARRGGVAMIPSDVYPVYAALASQAGASVKTYAAKKGLPTEGALVGCQLLLVCDPLKPWGGELSALEADGLRAWARADPAGRLVAIDSAYHIDWTPQAKLLVEEGSAMGLASLSKGWLAPWTAGLAVAPEAWAPSMREALGSQPKDASAISRGYEALAQEGDRPARVAKAVQALAGQAIARAAQLGEALRPWGYLAPSELSANEWLRRGALVLPASVFGSASSGSVVSVLEPTPARG